MKREGVWNKFFYSTILSGKEHLPFEWYLPLKIASSSGFIFHPLFLSGSIVKLALIPKQILSPEKFDAYYFRNKYYLGYKVFI